VSTGVRQSIQSDQPAGKNLECAKPIYEFWAQDEGIGLEPGQTRWFLEQRRYELAFRQAQQQQPEQPQQQPWLPCWLPSWFSGLDFPRKSKRKRVLVQRCLEKCDFAKPQSRMNPWRRRVGQRFRKSPLRVIAQG